MDTLEFTRQMRVKFNNLPKAKKDEIAWYQMRGMDAYATKLLMDAIGLVVIEKPNEVNNDGDIQANRQGDSDYMGCTYN